MKVLGIDATADDTCAAVVEDGQKILGNIVSSQSNLHEKFGGIVPQIAAYEHLKNIIPSVAVVLAEAAINLKEIDLFAVGLAPDPALSYYLTSLSTAKVFARVFKKPLVGVDHMEAHLLVNFVLEDPPSFPFVSLTVAGGHTILTSVRDFGVYEILGQTRDDAAGEAFDKVARILRLGYPGGPEIDEAARKGRADAFNLPCPMIKDQSFDFSYSGLKTAVWRLVKELKETPAADNSTPEVHLPRQLTQQETADIAASFRKAAVEVLVEKLFRAARFKGVDRVVLGGGVAANDLIREKVKETAARGGWQVYLPPKNLCTDNAVGIAVAGFYKFKLRGGDDILTLKHYRDRPLLNWR